MADTPLDAAAACTRPLKRPSGQLVVLNTISAVLCRQDGCLHVDVRAGSEGPGMACTLHAMCAQHGDMSSTTPLILSSVALPVSCNWLAACRGKERNVMATACNCCFDDSGLSHLRKRERDAEVRDLSPRDYQTSQLSGSWEDSVIFDCYSVS